ncbi:hypothetical protein DL96DRAFT_568350 [Flagelloscypha sp. PMI_526]|nr:hypothetical protein DL96DRAFT_568350 [Flagelloscypha sp. PMI_526]
MLTPEEDTALATIGRLTALNAIQVGVLFIFYGIYIGLYPLSVVLILCNRPRLATKIILGLTTIVFLSTSMHAISAFLVYMSFQVHNFYQSVGIPLLDRRAFSRADPRMTQAMTAYTWSLPINYIITDSIIVWRAYVIWRPVWIRMLLVAAMFGSATMSILYAAISTKHHFSWTSNPTIDRPLVVSFILLSFGVNLFATSLMGIKAWQYRKKISSVFNSSTTSASSSTVLNVLVLLVETGVVLCILQLLYAVVFLVTQSTISNWNTVRCAIQEVVFVLVALYPSLLIVMTLHSRFSLVESTTHTQNQSRASWTGGMTLSRPPIDNHRTIDIPASPKFTGAPVRAHFPNGSRGDYIPFDYKS